MKNREPYLFILLPLALMSIMAFTLVNGDGIKSGHNSSGAPSGYAGDPAGGNRNCTNCHGGSDAVQQAGWISSDIPETGYVSGTTYSITATATGAGISKFGFQVSAQNSSGTFLGTLVNTGTETKLISGTNYITHTSSGLSGDGSKVWTFNWTAPGSGSGEVVFYGAFNLADGNGGSSGDAIRLSTLTVNEDASTGFDPDEIAGQFSVYPNPARDELHVTTADGLAGSGYTVYDQAGKQVMMGLLNEKITMLSISHLKAGIYYVRIDGSNKPGCKFVKE